jgi:hypothetical protein
MKYSDDKQYEHLVRVRRVLVKDPDLSVVKITEMLGAKGLKLDRHYVGRIVDKLRRREGRMEQWRVNRVIGMFMNEMKEVKRHLWGVMTDPMARDSDKIGAAKAIIKADVEIFERMFDAGIFERKLGKLKIGVGMEDVKPLDEEGRRLAEAALILALPEKIYGADDHTKSEVGVAK